jgi:hypothetical protein
MAQGNKKKVTKPLRLRAEDAEDLSVIAACLQDAIVAVGAMTYSPKRRRFALLPNRFCWEAEAGRRFARRLHRRVLCGLHFDGVLSVRIQGIDRGQTDRVLDLLTIGFTPGPDAGGTVVLLFAGGSAVKLDVECIECQLRDLGEPWPVPLKPDHGLGGTA